MKKVIFSISLLLGANLTFAQTESANLDKKTTYGFQIGTSYSSILNQKDIPDIFEVSNGLEYKIGVQLEHKLSQSTSLLPKAEMSFNNMNFRNTSSNTNYQLNKTTINLMLHASRNFKNKTYFYAGPNLNVPLIDKSENNFITTQKPSYAIDFGYGLDFKKSNFTFAPEIRYTVGYNNVRNINNYDQSIFHTISLIFNFKD